MARPINVDAGGLPPDTLLFRRMTGSEELGRPFEYELDLLSSNDAISFTSLVGQSLAVHVEAGGSRQRHFHGLVTRFSYLGWEGRRAVYQASLRPSLWLMHRRAGCRIFQNQSVPQIVRGVLAEYGFPFEVSLSGDYPPREYVVQYRESDLDFVARLMEQEGIYYFFKHEAKKHTLVLADSIGAHAKSPGYEEIPFRPPQEGAQEREHLERWQSFHQIEPTAFSFRDYDFTRPRANLEVKRSGGGGQSPELEIYDYPGGYVRANEGERYARTRLEEAVARQERCEAAGDARGVGAGHLFKLAGHPRQDQNREYLVVSASYDVTMPDPETGTSVFQERLFRCRLTAQASSTPYRPPRMAPKPVVQGPQTARVVGKAGEEIWTDSYGRVKVEFHWDRASPGDEGSSCWVRVAQAWAGGGWGAMHIPRIGEEVVVHFLEGDPDRPIVAGHLYEADHMPPYALPAHQTRSGFKSRSTKGGVTDNANEVRFEDKKGEEQLYLQAERNYDLLVKNDATNTVGHDEKHEVKNDEAHSVGHDRRLSVGNDDAIEVKANRTEVVGGDESINISGGRTESVGKNESLSVGGSRSLTVTKGETIDIGQERSESVGKDATLTVQGGRSESVGKDLALSVDGGRTTSVGKGDSLEVGKALLVKAADQIVLESGDAKVVLKKNGDILLQGKNVTLKGSGKILIDGSDVVVKGGKIKLN